MNTLLIQNTKVISLPHFPVLSSHKQSNVITKHFTNLCLYLPKPELSLLTWLVYESAANNSFTYSTHLLRKFSAHIGAINLEYKETNLPTSIQIIRKDFKSLVEDGYVIPAKELHFINPMLVVSKKVNVRKYKEFCELYQQTGENIVADMAEYYLNNFK